MTYGDGTVAAAKAPATVLVVPCYNEGERLPVEALWAGAESRSSLRFLFVNDGSTDDTALVLSRLCNRAPTSFSVLTLPTNPWRGRGRAPRHTVGPQRHEAG